ncbi:MAG: hypothetical protein PHH36_09060 [Sideroxydans sp.]|nr:hypothetical protein [Sideroxydans sp.]
MKPQRNQGLLASISTEFATLPGVRAVVLAGSRGGAFADEQSDFDLYVYALSEPAESWRRQIADRYGDRISIGNRFWETGDEWVSKRSGTVVDIMYRAPSWIEAQLDNVLLRHQASVGYSTCFLYNVLHSQVLHDRDGWYAGLQARAAQPYPDELRRAIVAKNHPILRNTLSSYLHQISLALSRNDHFSVHHRMTALLASYFDILFAINRVPHPGEKRLVAQAQSLCRKLPQDFPQGVERLLRATAAADPDELPGRIHDLLDGLDGLLQEAGLLVVQATD